jgi:glycosyltransferase involved in cell wall biosynthesis
MKVLRINTAVNKGGAAYSAMNIQDVVLNMGVESWMLSDRGAQNLDKYLISLNESKLQRYLNVLAYRIFGIEGYTNTKLWEPILDCLDKYDVIHLHNVHGYYMPSQVLEVLLSKPCVWTLHDYWLVTGGAGFPYHEKEKKSFWEKIFPFARLRYPTEWVDRSKNRKKYLSKLIEKYEPSLVAITKDMSKKLKERGLESKKLNIIPHGLYSNITPPDINIKKNRRKLGWPLDKHIFLFVSAQVNNPLKGFDLFLEGLNRLEKKEKWAVYVIGDNYQLIKNKISNKNIDIEFLGKVEQQNLKYYYRACDTYVSCSFAETYGRTVVEALAEGVRVVCTDLPVFREVTAGNALYFQPGDYKDLVKKLTKSFSLPLSTGKQKKIAYEIRQRFSKKVMGQKYINLYENCL